MSGSLGLVWQKIQEPLTEAGFIRVLENLESAWFWSNPFQGLECAWFPWKVLESAWFSEILLAKSNSKVQATANWSICDITKLINTIIFCRFPQLHMIESLKVEILGLESPWKFLEFCHCQSVWTLWGHGRNHWLRHLYLHLHPVCISAPHMRIIPMLNTLESECPVNDAPYADQPLRPVCRSTASRL